MRFWPSLAPDASRLLPAPVFYPFAEVTEPRPSCCSVDETGPSAFPGNYVVLSLRLPSADAPTVKLLPPVSTRVYEELAYTD